MCTVSWWRAAADRRRDCEVPAGARWLGSCKQSPLEEELPVFKLSRVAGVRKSGWRSRGGAGASSGHLFWLGECGDHDLDAQDRRLDGERLHPRRKDRQVISCINFFG